MRVEEFERYLTEEELEMFKKRVYEANIEEYEILIKESDTLRTAIIEFFCWPNNEVHFWSEISHRKEPVR